MDNGVDPNKNSTEEAGATLGAAGLVRNDNLSAEMPDVLVRKMIFVPDNFPTKSIDNSCVKDFI